MVLTELKKVICEIKNMWNGPNGRIDTAEERTDELENSAIEVSQTEEREKRKGWETKYKQNLSDY